MADAALHLSTDTVRALVHVLWNNTCLLSQVLACARPQQTFSSKHAIVCREGRHKSLGCRRSSRGAWVSVAVTYAGMRRDTPDWLAAHHLIFPMRGRSTTAETTGNIGALLLVNKECKEVSVVTINRTQVLETVVVPL